MGSHFETFKFSFPLGTPDGQSSFVPVLLHVSLFDSYSLLSFLFNDLTASSKLNVKTS